MLPGDATVADMTTTMSRTDLVYLTAGAADSDNFSLSLYCFPTSAINLCYNRGTDS